MLIVIVIIGILASALIPRLSQARERANDTARKAHIQNIATVLIAYQIDKGRYPDTAGSINNTNTLGTALIGAGLSSAPTDPDGTRQFIGIQYNGNCTASPAWEYMYTPVTKKGIPRAGFVLMAGTQTEWWSNWVHQPTGSAPYTAAGCISDASTFDLILECQNLTQWSTPSIGAGGVCVYNQNQDNLRYIYKQ